MAKAKPKADKPKAAAKKKPAAKAGRTAAAPHPTDAQSGRKLISKAKLADLVTECMELDSRSRTQSGKLGERLRKAQESEGVNLPGFRNFFRIKKKSTADTLEAAAQYRSFLYYMETSGLHDQLMKLDLFTATEAGKEAEAPSRSHRKRNGGGGKANGDAAQESGPGEESEESSLAASQHGDEDRPAVH